jgi:hypothetical protein
MFTILPRITEVLAAAVVHLDLRPPSLVAREDKSHGVLATLAFEEEKG